MFIQISDDVLDLRHGRRTKLIGLFGYALEHRAHLVYEFNSYWFNFATFSINAVALKVYISTLIPSHRFNLEILTFSKFNTFFIDLADFWKILVPDCGQVVEGAKPLNAVICLNSINNFKYLRFILL